jgi:hypothetical protein
MVEIRRYTPADEPGLYDLIRSEGNEWRGYWSRWTVNVHASLLDEADRFAPYIETCTKEKLSWATRPAVHSYDVFPPPEEFPKLIEAYAKRNL